MNTSVIKQTVEGIFGTIELELKVSTNKIELSKEEEFSIAESLSAISKCLETEYFRRDETLQATLRKEEQDLIDLFGQEKIYAEFITNEYSGNHPSVSRWLIVTTDFGRVKIGWRKRVINIDWSGSLVTASADEIFPDEDVTKGDTYIHAWGLEKAQEYITTLYLHA